MFRAIYKYFSSFEFTIIDTMLTVLAILGIVASSITIANKGEPFELSIVVLVFCCLAVFISIIHIICLTIRDMQDPKFPE